MSFRPAPFLDHPDSSLDFRHMLMGASQIDSRTIRDFMDQSLDGSKFTIGMDVGDAETAVEIYSVDLLESLEDGLGRSIFQVAHRSETDVPAEGK